MRLKTPLYRYFSLLLATAVLLMTAGGQAVAAQACASSTAPSAATGATTVAKAYTDWKKAYVISAGSDQLRVQRSANDSYDTVSEGIAYGMLFASYSQDQATFDGLWRYAQNHMNEHGVMNWRIAANGGTTGYNGATDADEDMAIALIAADTQWGGYKVPATKLLTAIKTYEVEAGSSVVKPGDYWGGSDLLNPSYLAPSYYASFASYTGDSSWSAVQAASYKVLNAIHNRSDSMQSGLFPDWSNANGGPTNGMSYNYGYDASRTPLRLAMASAWNCDASANSLLTGFNATSQNLDLSGLASAYNLRGEPIAKGDSTPLLAAAAAAATSSSNATYRQSSWNALSGAKTGSYFPDSMRLFGLFIASGALTDPLQLTLNKPAATAPAAPASTATPAPVVKASVNLWWPSQGATVSGTQPFKAMVEGMDVNDYAMYWQVDGGQKNLMNNDYTGYQHKQADVSLKGWTWRGTGPYKLTFTAVNASGAVIGSTEASITIIQ